MRTIVFFLLSVAISKAATFNIACNYGALTSTIAQASSGDTINIAAGTDIISNQITIASKALTISGAGTNQTKFISTNIAQVILITGSPGLFTLCNMDLDGHSANATGFIVTSGGGGPYHFYNLQMTNNFLRGISPGGGDSFGLIDHCVFKNAATAGSYNNVSPQGNGYFSWATSNPLGTTNACYIEDCYFEDSFTNAGNGFLDSYDGAQVVMRHNIFSGGSVMGTHGYDSQAWSSRTSEIYNNIFTNWNLNASPYIIRGGVLMFFSNTIYSAGSVASTVFQPNLIYYRGAEGTYQGAYGYAGHIVDTNNTPTDHPFIWTTNWIDGGFANVAGQDIGFYYFKTSLAGQPAQRVLLGANLGESLTNLAYAINMDPAQVGTKYTSGTLTNTSFRVLHVTNGNELVMTNKMDGTNAYGYPAAMQPGTVFQQLFTAQSLTNRFTCYAWSNLCFAGGVWNRSDFAVQWSDDASIAFYAPNNITNLIVNGRDYSNAIPATSTYQPLTYPHPLALLENNPGVRAAGRINRIKLKAK